MIEMIDAVMYAGYGVVAFAIGYMVQRYGAKALIKSYAEIKDYVTMVGAGAIIINPEMEDDYKEMLEFLEITEWALADGQISFREFGKMVKEATDIYLAMIR